MITQPSLIFLFGSNVLPNTKFIYVGGRNEEMSIMVISISSLSKGTYLTKSTASAGVFRNYLWSLK